MDMKRQSGKDGESLSDPDLELELENDETDNKLMQTIKATVKRASLVCLDDRAFPVPGGIPKLSESESEYEVLSSDNSTEVEFGPDICKMLNINPTRSSSFRKQRSSMKIEGSQNLEDLPMRSKRIVSCPNVPGPVCEGVNEHDLSNLEDFLPCLEECQNARTDISHPSQPLAEHSTQTPVQEVIRPGFDIERISQNFWLPEMLTPRVASGPYPPHTEALNVLDELSSNGDSITSWGLSIRDSESGSNSKSTTGNGNRGDLALGSHGKNSQLPARRCTNNVIYRTPPPLRLKRATKCQEQEMAFLRGSVSLSRQELEAIGIDKIVEESRQAQILYEKAKHGVSVVLNEIKDETEGAHEEKGKPHSPIISQQCTFFIASTHSAGSFNKKTECCLKTKTPLPGIEPGSPA